MNGIQKIFRKLAGRHGEVPAETIDKIPNTAKKQSLLEKHGFTSIMKWPNRTKSKSEELRGDYFLRGYVPAEPVIGKEVRITAFGSCFAGHVSRYLVAKGYNVNAHKWSHNESDLIRIDEIMVHTPALRTQFEWAFNDKPLGAVFIGGAEEKARTYHELDNVKALITNSDVYIITLGLTEAWYDLGENQYLWKFVPHRKLDANRFVSRSVTYQENLDNIEAIYALIRAKRPAAHVVFTLSPIPLLGTYSGKAIVCANAFSKAKLRAAVGEFIQNHTEDSRLFYFPSYELVTQHLRDPWEDDNRHITPQAIQSIMEIFDQKFLIKS